MSKPYLSVGEVAAIYGLNPRVITDLIYRRHLDESRCPMMGSRRMIPNEYIPEIASVLRGRGLIPPLSKIPKFRAIVPGAGSDGV